MNLILVFPLYAAVTDAESAHLGKIRIQKYKFFLINEDSHNYFLILHASKAGQPVKGRVFSILFCLLTAVFGLSARNIPSPADSLLAEGDRLHRLYRFEEALDCYGRALREADDPAVRAVLEQRYQHSQNALNMTDICEDVTVVARRRFARKDFFLYYPLKNQSWRSAPNVLDPSGSGEVPTYAPKGSREVFFSASDASGARNLYVTRDLDSLWSVPRLLGEGLLSSGNEIFPMRSPDGKTLYFASDGLTGMGGYDLYAATWDEEVSAWGEPVNLGFPYNSPGDDFLRVDSEDGRYSIFASNRNCSPDSVYVYVIEYQALPRRVPVRDPEALSRMASLIPQADLSRQDHGSAVSEGVRDNDNTLLYKEKMAEARTLRDSIYVRERRLDQLRERLTEGGEGTAASISQMEEELTPLRRLLEETNRAVRRIEQSFLKNGVMAFSDRSDREVVGAGSSYTFTKNAIGARLKLKLATAPPSAAEAFRIAPVGRFAQNTTLPEGVVYQIQFLTTGRHASLDDIQGLSPVYERMTPSLKYVYSVGVFITYDEALSHLNEVRSLGFPEAGIIAFMNGRPTGVGEARRAESAGTGR